MSQASSYEYTGKALSQDGRADKDGVLHQCSWADCVGWDECKDEELSDSGVNAFLKLLVSFIRLFNHRLTI